ncbi:hypothetical protein HYQ46_013253 [Verticillium longisporum]|nr:hypothetical protein HYQ46_013253 [Verticillium longisporum]
MSSSTKQKEPFWLGRYHYEDLSVSTHSL